MFEALDLSLDIIGLPQILRMNAPIPGFANAYCRLTLGGPFTFSKLYM